MTGRDELETDVVVVGGGGCGLAASIMLSDLGVDHILVERHPSTALMPKAHILNPRTMEIFAQHGLAEEVYAAGAPHENNSAMRWYTSLGGDEPWHHRHIHRVDAWGGGDLRQIYAQYSAMRHGNTPQLLLEPLLRRHAEQRGPGRVRFHHEVHAVDQDEEAVTTLVRDRDTGSQYRLRSRYLLAADGGKTVGPALGIRLEGPAPFVETISVYFRADLSPYLDEDDALIRSFNRPTLAGTPIRTGLVAAGPTRWDRFCPEWTVSVTLPAGEDPADFTDEQAATAVRERLNLPNLPIEVIRHTRWSIESLLADRYQVGRCFVAGDAAHRHSPFGGLGLNTAIQDAHNLAWKLAAVCAGHATSSLLASYEPERRPVGRNVVDFATVAFFNTLTAPAGFGLLPGASTEYNHGVLDAIFSDTRIGEYRRARLREYFDTMRMEARAADIELGYDYADSPAILPDGTPPPDRDPTGHMHQPTTRPGHRLPHAWFDQHGRQLASHDLLHPGALLVLAGDQSQPWQRAVDTLSADGTPIHFAAVGPHAQLSDRYGNWTALRGHDDTGALLVRPDGHVGARFATADDAHTQLSEGVARVLTQAYPPANVKFHDLDVKSGVDGFGSRSRT